MNRYTSVLKMIGLACFTLAVLAIAPATIPTQASSATTKGSIEHQHTTADSSAQASLSQQQTTLYQKLCDLNRNWVKYSPDLDLIADPHGVMDEVSLIQTHLKLVIDQLLSADLRHLNPAQRQQRHTNLQTLKTYAANGQFPQNVFTPDRRPVFIDPWGTHCAVGHLIATSGNSELAISINEDHQLDLLCDIKTDGLIQWQHSSGFSLDELALIQPTYRSTTLKYPQEIEALILGNSESIKDMIESGERSVDARCGGKTLLHFAAAAGDLELVKLLVSQGADLHAVSTLGCPQADIQKGGSQKIVEVRWDQPTAVRSKGGLGIGDRANVYKTLRGKYVAYLLNDLRGGRVGLSALDYSVDDERNRRFAPPIRWAAAGYQFGRPPQKRAENPELVALKKDRAAVTQWLKSQLSLSEPTR